LGKSGRQTRGVRKKGGAMTIQKSSQGLPVTDNEQEGERTEKRRGEFKLVIATNRRRSEMGKTKSKHLGVILTGS